MYVSLYQRLYLYYVIWCSSLLIKLFLLIKLEGKFSQTESENENENLLSAGKDIWFNLWGVKIQCLDVYLYAFVTNDCPWVMSKSKV